MKGPATMDINNYSYTMDFLPDEEPTQKKEPFYYWKNHDIRVISLDIVYMIKGYHETSLKNKNFIYDHIQTRIRKLIEMEK